MSSITTTVGDPSNVKIGARNSGGSPETAPLGIVCPICHATMERERVAVAALAESRDDASTLRLCAHHLWLTVERGLPYRALVTALDELLTELDQPEPRFGRAEVDHRCPLCADVDEAARIAFAQSADPTNLCLPHLAQALRRHALSASSEVAARFIASGRALERELSELIRKADYRFRDEPRGAERDSWLRALARVAGAPRVSRLEATRQRRGGRAS